MSRASHSKVECYWSCPFCYKLKYIDKLKTKPDQSPTNALHEGTSIHEAIEKRDKVHGIENYKSNFNNLNIEHEIEIYKLEKAMDKAIAEIPHGEYEYKILTEEFIGYIDMLVHIEDNIYDLYDFKYSNGDYKDSGQVHVYKYFYERLTGNIIRNMYYVMIPKCPEKYEDGCDIDKLKDKIDKYYNTHHIRFDEIEYDKKKISFFFARKTLMEKETVFEKRYSFRCNWCDFRKFCSSKGADKSELLLDEDSIEYKEANLWD